MHSWGTPGCGCQSHCRTHFRLDFEFFVELDCDSTCQVFHIVLVRQPECPPLKQVVDDGIDFSGKFRVLIGKCASVQSP
jgi:hypothetical protein